MVKRKKGFTLIELIAILVIMAIIALIVIPLVMSIIRKAKISARKRSVDAYGSSIELAIAGYLLDNGTFPTSIEDLTIEYSGDEVVCSTTQLNPDSSVYLEDCTVGGRSVDYTYGTDKTPTYTAYSVGDEITYNNVAYRVIKDSGLKEQAVTLLKSEPLTVAEVNQYGSEHVNRYTFSSVGTAKDINGYGGVAYYSSPTCRYYDIRGCTTDYAQSDIKYIVDAWKASQAPAATEARLMEDADFENLGYKLVNIDSTGGISMVWKYTSDVPSWVHDGIYSQWTMSQYHDDSSRVWAVVSAGNFSNLNVDSFGSFVRPVITISKSAL